MRPFITEVSTVVSNFHRQLSGFSAVRLILMYNFQQPTFLFYFIISLYSQQQSKFRSRPKHRHTPHSCREVHRRRRPVLAFVDEAADDSP